MNFNRKYPYDESDGKNDSIYVTGDVYINKINNEPLDDFLNRIVRKDVNTKIPDDVVVIGVSNFNSPRIVFTVSVNFYRT